MSYLILVKHAMPEIAEGVPSAQWHLSSDGRQAAAAFAQILEAYAPTRIFSSHEPKARETAEIIARHFGLLSQSRDGLEEHHRHTVPFLAAGSFEAAVRGCLEKPSDRVFGEETADEAAVRFHSAVDAIDMEASDDNVAVVAHGTVISLYVSSLTGIAPFTVWEQLGLPSCVVIPRADRTCVKIVNPDPTPPPLGGGA